MHSGFKGDRIGIDSVLLEGDKVIYEISYIDQDGVRHGHMRHSRAILPDTAFSSAVDALVTLLLNEAAALHFKSPMASTESFASEVKEKTNYGLRESLSGPAAAQDEPDATPE